MFFSGGRAATREGGWGSIYTNILAPQNPENVKTGRPRAPFEGRFWPLGQIRTRGPIIIPLTKNSTSKV